LLVADQDGDDGGLAVADAVPHGTEALAHRFADGQHTVAALGLGLDHLEGGGHGSHVGWRHAGAKDQGAGKVLDVIDHIGIARNHAAERGKRLAEGAHNEIDLVGEPKVGRGAAAMG